MMADSCESNDNPHLGACIAEWFSAESLSTSIKAENEFGRDNYLQFTGQVPFKISGLVGSFQAVDPVFVILNTGNVNDIRK